MPGQSTGQRGAVASTTTFLFTDIEGSTKILQQLGREYEKVLEIHRRMLRKAFHDNHGKEVKVDGDAFFVAFPSAGQAVAASVSAQRELARYRWPQGQSVRVRIGLHTGEAIETGNDYVGIDVHRAARIGAAAHGGQILLSQTTATLAEPSLGEGVSVRDLGEYRLKDLTRPERIFQIDIDGLPADFPPLRSVDYTPNNLPTQLTSFIGREQELAEAKRLLGTTRLLTLTGSGGSGKTRLGIQLAADVAAGFPDGVYFVPLAAIRDAHLVPSSIAQNIGLQELQDAGDRTLLERLSSFLRDKQMLVVLDNFEQLLAAGSVVADVLRSTQTVQVVVTSRSPLRISGEQEFAVPPLAVPEQRAAPSPASIAGCASVRLFCERAVAALPDFAIDDDNAAHVAHITRRLDGLPLAIELAAARIKLLPPEAMLPRLEHSLRLLVGGGRDLADRQQTLRNTIAWSYELLAGGPKRLLAACSVFRGGASLESIESVCEQTADIGMPVLDALDELLGQSLIRRIDSSHRLRFAMLETIREFAAERLTEGREETAVLASHAGTFLALAVEAQQQLTGPGEKEGLTLLDVEHDNIRAALDWYTQNSPSSALQLGAAMSDFWFVRGHFTEGRARLARLLDLAPDVTRTRVSALNGAAYLAIGQGDYPDAADKLSQSLEMSRKVGDKHGEGMALLWLGLNGIMKGSFAEGSPHLDNARNLLRETNDVANLGRALFFSGLVASFTDQFEEACDRIGQAVDVLREVGFRSIGARALAQLGAARIFLGDLVLAREAIEEALRTSVDIGDQWHIPTQLAGFAGLAAKTGRPRQALRLAGAATAYSAKHEFSLPRIVQVRLDGWLAPARKAVGTAAGEILAEGTQMTLEEAVASALGNQPEEGRPTRPQGRLTRRELEIAMLVAQGLTNRQIANQLYLSVRTVDVHVDHILTKFDFNSRTQLAAWVYQSSLLSKNT